MDGRDGDMRVYGADGVGLREARSDMGRGTPHPKPSTPLLSCLQYTQLLNKCNLGLNCSSLISEEAKKENSKLLRYDQTPLKLQRHSKQISYRMRSPDSKEVEALAAARKDCH